MLVDDAVSAVLNLVGSMSPVPGRNNIIQLLKAATAEFARYTPVTVMKTDITLSGASTYELDDNRIGELFKADHVVDSTTVYDAQILPVEWFKGAATHTSGSSAYFSDGGICRVSTRELRVYPAVSSGTLRLFHSPVPVMISRDSDSSGAESVIASPAPTSTSVAVSTLSHGRVADLSTTSSYFTGCRIVFTSGSASGYGSWITNYAEGATSSTLTFSPSISATISADDKFTIRDVLEINPQYAHDCVAYAAGVIGLADASLKGGVAPMMLRRYETALEVAKRKSYSDSKGTRGMVVTRTHDSDYF